jgi:hypothetical protein
VAGISKQELMTRYAREASDLAVDFVKALGGQRLGAHVAELTGPDGISTQGGALAVMHLRLVSREGGPALLVGNVQVREASVELRSFDRLEAIHRDRWGTPLPVERDAYDAFLAKVDAWFKDQGFRTAVAQVTPSVMPKAAPASSPVKLIAFVVAVVLVALVIVVVAMK